MQAHVLTAFVTAVSTVEVNNPSSLRKCSRGFMAYFAKSAAVPYGEVLTSRDEESGAVGCAFEPRRAHSLSDAILIGKIRPLRFSMFAHQNARINHIFAKY